jgi:site-specific DNA-methyltransferase (adenine-specific)
MNVLNLPLREIHPYENNPRKNDKAVAAVAESIRQYGFLVPLVISAEHEIITGHTRYKAAQQMGLCSVPCVIADDLTEEQIKAFRLVDNKVGEISEWDMDLLPLEIADIAADLTVFGFESVSEEAFGEDFSLDEGGKKPFQQISLTLHDEQAALLHAAIKCVYDEKQVSETFGNENHNGNGIYEVVRQWAQDRHMPCGGR